MTVQEYLKFTYEPNNKHQTRHKIKCKDGYEVSVQGGTHYHYCEPRKHCNVYQRVELGFPSEKDYLIMPYIDGYDEDPTRTVYGYVPICVVEELIEKHGGIDVERTLNLKVK